MYLSAAIKLSGTSGFSGPAILRVHGVDAFEDLSGNKFNNAQNLVVETLLEIADTSLPTILNCSLNYSTGTLVLTFSEIVNFDERLGIVNCVIASCRVGDLLKGKAALRLIGSLYIEHFGFFGPGEPGI